MSRTILLRLGAILLGVFAAPALRASILDTSFDHDGVQFYQHPYANQGSADRPIANCPAGDGQVVVSRAGENTLIIRRLRFDGSQEGSIVAASFSSYAIHSGSTQEDVSLCRPDGGILLAMSATESASNKTKILLFAIGADGEFLRDAFVGGSLGYVSLSLSEYSDRTKVPRSFNRTPDGGALLAGSFETAEGYRPFVARFEGPMAQYVRANTFVPPGLRGSIHATAAGVGPGGGIWVVGHGRQEVGPDPAYRAYLNPDDLSLAHTELFSLPGDQSVRTFGGGMVREGVMAVGATRRVGNHPGQPVLLVLREGGVFTGLDLPAPLPLATGLVTGINAESVGPVLPQTGNRVLYAATAEAFEGTNFLGYRGWYFARAYVGASPAEDRIDSGFGDDGQAVLSLKSGENSCVNALNRQHHARLGLWQGRPTVLGSIKRHCNPDSEDDLVLMRLKSADALFEDSFE